MPRRSRRLVLALTIAALVALAGCGALQDASTTRDPFGVDASTKTLSPAVANGSVLAFDAERDHAPDADVVVDAHVDALAEESHAIAVTRVWLADGETVYREDRTVRFAANRSRYRRTATVRTPDERRTVAAYANGTHVWRHRVGTERNDTTLLVDGLGRPLSPAAARGALPVGRLEAALEETTVTEVERITSASGVPPEYDVTVGRTAPVFHVTARSEAASTDDVRNASLSLYVTRNGRVLGWAYEYEVTDDKGRTITVRTTVAYTAIGDVTVSEPDWVAGAANDSAGQVAVVAVTATIDPGAEVRALRPSRARRP